MEYGANTLEPHWMPFTGNRDFKADPRIIVGGDGIHYQDHKGGSVLDGSSGLFCCPLGHGRRVIVFQELGVDRVGDRAPPFQLGTPGSFEAAARLTRILPEPLDHVFFGSSGSEAVDTALKIVMAYHRARGEGHRNRYVSRERAYHGVNIGGLSLSGMVKNREAFSHVMPNVAIMRHTWDADQTFTRGQPEDGAHLADDLARFCEAYGGSSIAACFVEPVAGSTGCLVPPKGYLERLRQICDEHGILLVFDDVICGFGRLGGPFSADVFGVVPDIMTLAKAVTNGCQPMGVVAVTGEIYRTVTEAAPENAVEMFHGYTYSAHPAACAAAIATLKIYEEETSFERAAELSPYFQDALFSLEDLDCLKDIRGIGMMGAIELKPRGAVGAAGTQFQKDLFWSGIHVKFTGDCGILAPAFIYKKEDIDNLIDGLRAALEKLD